MYQVVALAASAGGLKALSQVLNALPAGFPVPIVVVQHLDPRRRSALAEILARRSALQVLQASQGVQLKPGIAYIAPPDRHLLVHPDGRVQLTQTPPVRFSRPSADPMFESIAASFGARAIAVVLSGSGRDGAIGITAIKKAGGTVIVQDEATSEFFGMPGAAQRTGLADFVLPLQEIAPALARLAMQSHAA